MTRTLRLGLIFALLAAMVSLARPAHAAGPIFINEIFLNPPGTDIPNEYLEFRGAPSSTIPAGTYFVGVEGDSSSTIGDVQTIINLSGLTFGSNGYLVLLENGNSYSTAPGATVITSTSAGYGGLPGGIFSADSGATDLENATVSFFVVQTATAPTLTDDIDGNNDGTPDAVYAGWTILDSIGSIDNDNGDFGYAALNFKRSGGTGTSVIGTVVTTVFTPGYLGRQSDTTGSAEADWVVGDSLGGSVPNWVLAAATYPASFNGKALNHIGKTNFAASNPVITFARPGVSGVISDPTQPSFAGAGNGITFTVSDDVTPNASLIVSLSNATNIPSVLTSATLVTVNAAAGQYRLDLGTPGGTVGYANLTISVTDTDSNTTNAVFRYGASQFDAGRPNALWITGSSDGSAAVQVDSSYMIVADDENQGLRLYSRSASGLPVNTFDFTSSLGLTDISNGIPREVDIEGADRIGNRIYWLGSQSNSSSGAVRPNRYRLFATDITGSGSGATLSYVGRFDNLRSDMIAWDSSNGHGLGANFLGLAASATIGVIPETPDGSGWNIEGFAVAPNGTTGYIAFRAPTEPTSNRTKALIVPVTNLAALVTGNPTVVTASFGAPIQLDLGGRGIRDIRCAVPSGCLIIGGPVASAGTFKLYFWTGNPTDPAIERAADLSGLNPEGIVELPFPILASSSVQLVSDLGDTIFYNDGTIAKDLPINEHKKSRVDTVIVGAAVGVPTATITTVTVTITPTATHTPTALPALPDTVGVYLNGFFYLRNSNSAGAAEIIGIFGGDASDLPVAGDWNGDGVDSIGVYRGTTGEFFLSDSNTSPSAAYAPVFGNPGDTPFAGRWTADMTHDGLGVYRPSNGILFEKKQLITGFSDFFAIFGNPGDQGIGGDWDGSGFDSVGIYRSANQTWYLTNNSQPSGITFSDIAFVWDIAVNSPVVGDWDANGSSTVGYLTANGVFTLHSTNATAGTDNTFAFGPVGGKPIAGKWIAGARPALTVNVVGSNAFTNEGVVSGAE